MTGRMPARFKERDSWRERVVAGDGHVPHTRSVPELRIVAASRHRIVEKRGLYKALNAGVIEQIGVATVVEVEMRRDEQIDIGNGFAGSGKAGCQVVLGAHAERGIEPW